MTYTDPVCNMQLDDKTVQAKSTFQGQTQYFCSEECKQKFDQNPQQYIRKTA